MKTLLKQGIETTRYAHLLPDDLNETFKAIENKGTASNLSQIYHTEKKEKGIAIATPLIFMASPTGFEPVLLP